MVENKRIKLFNVAKLEDAKGVIEKLLKESIFKKETVNIEESLGLYCFEDIFSGEDVPNFDRSIVDGFALKAKDTFGATDSIPSIFRYIGQGEMGKIADVEIKDNECFYVATGGMIPKGADAVSMIEYSDFMDKDVLIYKPCSVNANIIKKGEDIKKKDKLIESGVCITPMHIGMLAAVGINEIPVFKKIRVGIISTGDELKDYKKDIKEGEVRDINSVVLSNLIKQRGFEVSKVFLAKDSFEEIEKCIKEACKISDVVFISGGTSTGVMDFVANIVKERGELLIHGVAIKPGKPTLIGKIFNKPILGLPGHPMACLLAYKLLFEEVLLTIYNSSKKRCVFLKTTSNFHSDPGKVTIQPVEFVEDNKEIKAKPIFYKSGLVSALKKADGYIIIDDDVEGIYKDQEVKVYLI